MCVCMCVYRMDATLMGLTDLVNATHGMLHTCMCVCISVCVYTGRMPR